MTKPRTAKNEVQRPGSPSSPKAAQARSMVFVGSKTAMTTRSLDANASPPRALDQGKHQRS
jgi:hypothetical protein